MKNHELERLPDWRFTKVRHGDKKPYPNGWQNNPLELKDIPQGDNLGLLTGPASNGVLAIDFDGLWAWEKWAELFPFDPPLTVSWTSGREYRQQLAYKVPMEAWGIIKTTKLTQKDIPAGQKPEGLEFRWQGAQSVMPPSLHPEGHTYTWINAPSAVAQVAELPYEVLAWLVNYAPQRILTAAAEEEAPDLSNVTDSVLEECVSVLERIKQAEPVLNYNDWRDVTWAVASHIGTAAAPVVMAQFWPEQRGGEYRRLMQGYNYAASPKFGSLVFRANRKKTISVRSVFKPQQDLIRQAFGR